jgi:hypothetical protein
LGSIPKQTDYVYLFWVVWFARDFFGVFVEHEGGEFQARLSAVLMVRSSDGRVAGVGFSLRCDGRGFMALLHELPTGGVTEARCRRRRVQVMIRQFTVEYYPMESVIKNLCP